MFGEQSSSFFHNENWNNYLLRIIEYHILNTGISGLSPFILWYFSRLYATVLSSSFYNIMYIMYPPTQQAVKINSPFIIDSVLTSNTNCLRWYYSSIYLCFFIVDSAIGIMGVCLNYSMGRSSIKFLGSSHSIVPGILMLTIWFYLALERYLEPG